ncbi:hypothetical protein SAPIO_CDS6762 [Scedosporium apiospermum]|uniref:C6 transcription factor n=1 Tax=Pseudallescheria apiosperma TaxID=563466 RepID=A0A084G370_PSEDA|nr:uncharacterized protein SAPIO_CDS6762 [Scedosporium apiospermum]KEZ41782.1 hypothetical protein SAPIO_CDS6762 [Scedosporium apiospermum]
MLFRNTIPLSSRHIWSCHHQFVKILQPLQQREADPGDERKPSCIVDVTFGPGGPKRTRRHLVQVDPTTDSDDAGFGVENSATPEQSSSFLSTVLEQRALPGSRNATKSISLPDEASPASRESLDLEVLDYLASNPFNLDLLAENPSPKHAVASEDMNTTRVMHGFPPVTPESAAGSSPDLYMAYCHDPAYKELHSSFHDHMVKTARNIALTRQGTPETFPSTLEKSPEQPPGSQASGRDFSHGPSGGRSRLVNFHMTEERYVELWQNYLDEIAPWLDMFDNANNWRTTVAHMAQREDCLQYSLLALSARQQERKNPGKPHTESLNLYQEAIRLIMVKLPTLRTEIIAACVLLCVLEMMCSSPRAWGKHLDGCAMLLEAAGVNGVVGGVREALFWTFARMDVYKALIADTITTFPTNRWFISADSMSAAVRLFKGKSGSDSYANYAVFLCAGVVNILSNNGSPRALSDRNSYATFVSRWKAMYDLLEGWYNDRPEEMRPLMYVPSSKGETNSPFSTILYSTPPGISSNQMYHASMILLLQDKPKEIVIPKSRKSMLWHARQICGISLSNSDHGALINALQPIWIAGRLMSHHSEHKAILDTLKYIEETTGWATSWRAKDLKEFWGVCDEEL